MKRIFWTCLALIAALWPSRLAGPLDGAPLDQPAEAVIIGGLLVWLLATDRSIATRASARLLIATLLLWKVATGMVLAQDGWCLRFTSPGPLYLDNLTVPHSWDVRADWRAPVPQCSAVMTETYPVLERFPAWFLNLAPADRGRAATAEDRPPNIELAATLSGYLHPNAPGTLQVAAGEDISARLEIDDREVPADTAVRGVALDPGLHRVAIDLGFRRSHWSLSALWNGVDVWFRAPATLTPPSGIDRLMRPWGRAVTPVLLLGLVLIGVVDIVRRARAPAVLGYASTVTMIAVLAAWSGREWLIRALPVLLLGGAAIMVPIRLRNLFGFCLLVGLPFLALFVARGYPQVGLFTWYSGGDDWWMFQRFAYRIVMQGHWLEGGEPAFWYQPLYRWIAGAAHMVFGDSSVGELWLDAAAASIGSAFAFHTVKSFAGFRYGIIAGALTLTVYTLGPTWYIFGRGLSEFVSSGFLYAAALCALRARSGNALMIVAAGGLATLAFLARLNNLPIALAVAVFALPIRYPIGNLFRLADLRRRASMPIVAGVLSFLALGIYFFSWRTWYYTGQFDMFWGTSRRMHEVVKAGDSLLPAVASSVMMLLTVNDPPKIDLRALPVMLGFLAAVAGTLRIGRFRLLPLGLVVFVLAGVSSALVVRGGTYIARFSIHIIPVTVAVAVCGLSLVFRRPVHAAPGTSAPGR